MHTEIYADEKAYCSVVEYITLMEIFKRYGEIAVDYDEDFVKGTYRPYDK